MLVYCKKHKNYAVKGKPKLPCEACWALWFCRNDFILVDDLPMIANILERKSND